jgi:hypothetical protein
MEKFHPCFKCIEFAEEEIKEISKPPLKSPLKSHILEEQKQKKSAVSQNQQGKIINSIYSVYFSI